MRVIHNLRSTLKDGKVGGVYMITCSAPDSEIQRYFHLTSIRLSDPIEVFLMEMFRDADIVDDDDVHLRYRLSEGGLCKPVMLSQIVTPWIRSASATSIMLHRCDVCDGCQMDACGCQVRISAEDASVEMYAGLVEIAPPPLIAKIPTVPDDADHDEFGIERCFNALFMPDKKPRIIPFHVVRRFWRSDQGMSSDSEFPYWRAIDTHLHL